MRLLEQGTGWSSAVDHAASHGDCSRHDMVEEAWLAGMAHGIDAAFRDGEVDGPGEVEWDSTGISEV